MEFPHVKWRTSSHSTQQGNCIEIGTWHRSSHSAQEGHCVEINPWRTSSHSTGNGGECIELAADEAVVLARDSKDPDGAVLGFGADAWAAFLTTVKDGHLDLR